MALPELCSQDYYQSWRRRLLASSPRLDMLLLLSLLPVVRSLSLDLHLHSFTFLFLCPLLPDYLLTRLLTAESAPPVEITRCTLKIWAVKSHIRP
ncbi:hypothetical protein EDB85DRAFT_1953226, partial [Lactarius pseudohatsudake]